LPKREILRCAQDDKEREGLRGEDASL